MLSVHANSPCCGCPSRRFGGRRRQCPECGRTWRIRQRRRGRPRRRVPEPLLHKVFVQGFSLAQLAARRRGVAVATYRYRFRQALRRFVARPSSVSLPVGPLVLLADGMWFQFGGTPWVLYLMAVKASRGQQAVFLDPLLLPGNEAATRWRTVFATLPPDLTARVQALVVDNLRGMRPLALQYGWTLQLCHFHLLLKLQVRWRGRRYALRGGHVRDDIDRLTRGILTHPEGKALQSAIRQLRQLSRGDCGTHRIQRIVREFLRQHQFYRSYLTQPSLGLPRTTNSVESMGRLIRELFRRNRAGSNPTAVLTWATAFIRMRPQLTCNGHPFNQIS